MKIDLIDRTIDLGASELLRSFDVFDPAEWTIVRHSPKWIAEPTRISGGGPAEPTHGQIFCATPVVGDVVLEFDARIIPPSYHDIVWFWNVRLDKEPWSAGYLGCLGGWWSGMAGIEKLPSLTSTPCVLQPLKVYPSASASSATITSLPKAYSSSSGSSLTSSGTSPVYSYLTLDWFLS